MSLSIEEILEKLKGQPSALNQLRSDISAYSKEQIDKLYLDAIDANPEVFFQFSDEDKTYDLCFAAVKRDAITFRAVPKPLQDEKICQEAFKQYPDAIILFDEKFQTNDLWREAVSRNLNVIKNIPKPYQIFDLYKEAILKDPNAIEYAPKEMRNFELCSMLFSDQLKDRITPALFIKYLMNFEQVSALTQGEFDKLTTIAIKEDPMTMEFASNNVKKDLALCKEAVKKNWRVMRFLPVNMQKEDFYLEAIDACRESLKANWHEIQYVPDDLLDKDFVALALQKGKEAITDNGYELQYIPEKLRDYPTCLAAVKSSSSALEYVPRNICDYQICLEAVQRVSSYGEESLFKNIKKLFETKILTVDEYQDLRNQLLLKNGGVLMLLAKEERDFTVCFNAIKNNPYMLRAIENFSEETLLNEGDFKILCSEALKVNSSVISFVPKSFRTFPMYLDAVNKNWRVLTDIRNPEVTPSFTREEINLLFIEAFKEHAYSRKEIFASIDNTEDAKIIALALINEGFNVLQYIPEPLRDFDICKQAVLKNPAELANVPTDILKANNFLSEIVIQNGYALKYIPKELVTMPLCEAAVKNNSTSSSLEWVPVPFRTAKLCQVYLQNKDNIYYILSKIKNFKENSALSADEYKALALEVVKTFGYLLKDVDIEMRDSELCYAAIRQSAHALEYVPVSQRTFDLCNEAIQKDTWNGQVIEHLKNFRQTTLLSPDQYKTICMFFIKKSGFNLKYVDEDMRDADLCLEAVKESGRAIEFVPKAICTYSICYEAITKSPSAAAVVLNHIKDFAQFSALSELEYKQLCLEAVKNYGLALKEMDEKYIDFEVASNAVRKDVDAIQYVPDPLRSKMLSDYDFCVEMVKTNPQALRYISPDFRQKMLTADFALSIVKKNGLALEFIPDPIRNETIYSEAVNQNGLALNFVPIELRTEALCLAAIDSNTAAIQFFPEKLRTYNLYLQAVLRNPSVLEELEKNKRDLQFTPDEYKSLCVAALQQDTMALKFIDEAIKVDLIDMLGVDKILSMDYEARKYFPKGHDYQPEINQFLSGIKHIVLTRGSHFGSDHESRDVFMVYSSHAKRAGHAIHTSTEDAQQLFDDIKKASNKENINLVLLGHARVESTDLAGMNVDAISNFVEKNENINRVTLLGCKTAQALKPEEEKLMFTKFTDMYEREHSNSPCGMVLMSRTVEPSEYANILKKVCKPKEEKEKASKGKEETTGKEKEAKTPNQTYILAKIQKNGKEHYELTHLSKMPSGEIMSQNFLLQPDEIKALQKNILTEKGKYFVFPKKENDITWFRGGAGAKPLEDAEFNKIKEVINKFGVFDKENPRYKAIKSELPTLSTVTLKENESDKLKSSLFKKLYDRLLVDRDLDIKAYTGIVSVDTKEQRILGTPNMIYTNEYGTVKKPTFFTRKDNIERGELDRHRKGVIRNVQDKKLSDDSEAKGLKIRAKRKHT